MSPFHYHEGDGQYGHLQVKSAGWETFQETGPAGKFSINQPMPQASPFLHGLGVLCCSIHWSQSIPPLPPCGADGAAGACEDPPPPLLRLPEGR